MRVIGVGVDATEIERVVRLYERHPQTFLDRVFTKSEREYCLSRKRNFGESLAARWAAKEAVLKALGTGWSSGVDWKDVEVVNLPSGAPELRLSGVAKKIADEKGAAEWKLSLTHCKTLAIAYVVASGPDTDARV